MSGQKKQNTGSGRGSRGKQVETVSVEQTMAQSLHAEAIAAWREAVATGEAAGVVASRAAHAAAPFIGKGKVWASWQAWAEPFGVAPATVTAWRRQGRVLALGLDPENSPEDRLTFTRIQSVGNRDPRIREAIDSDRPTLTKVRAAVKSAHPRGKYAPPASTKGSTGRSTKGSTGQQVNKGSEAPTFTNVPAALTALETAANYLSAKRPNGLSASEAERLAGVLTILESMTTASTAAAV
jgi:hypothetical protein